MEIYIKNKSDLTKFIETLPLIEHIHLIRTNYPGFTYKIFTNTWHNKPIKIHAKTLIGFTKGDMRMNSPSLLIEHANMHPPEEIELSTQDSDFSKDFDELVRIKNGYL